MMSKLMNDIIRENIFIENIECLRKKIKIIKKYVSTRITESGKIHKKWSTKQSI
jgi:hypothetical protein